jgi:hypothetical protein
LVIQSWILKQWNKEKHEKEEEKRRNVPWRGWFPTGRSGSEKESLMDDRKSLVWHFKDYQIYHSLLSGALSE